MQLFFIHTSNKKALEKGSTQHLKMNGATGSHLAKPWRTAYLKADVSRQEAERSSAKH